MELKNEEQEFIRSAEDEIKAKAAKKAAQKRELPDSDVNGSPAKKANLTEVKLCILLLCSSYFQVTLQMMKERNEEFESKMNSVERASKELRLILTPQLSIALVHWQILFSNQIINSRPLTKDFQTAKTRYGAQLELVYFFDKTEARCFFPV